MNSPDLLQGARLGICIVAWRCGPLVVDCLRSIQTELGSVPGTHVCIVDNASGDDTADVIERAIVEGGWSQWATLVRAPKNGGFAYGNNRAIEALRASGKPFDYFVLLNPDTIVRPGALRILSDFMNARPDVGLAGGRSEDPDGTPQACCFRFPSIAREVAATAQLGIVFKMLERQIGWIGNPEVPTEVDWVSGAYVIIRPALLDEIGLMDESYFLYFEETDFILRAQRAGWACWHVPESRIVHLVGKSSGVTTRFERPKRLPSYWFESRRRYFLLNHGRMYAIAVDLAVAVAYTIARPIRLLTRHWYHNPPHFLGDLLRHSALLRGRHSTPSRRIPR